VNSRARRLPFAAYSAANSGSASIRRDASKIRSTSVGSTRSAASPSTSGIEVTQLDTTGTPQAIASSGGRPKPSFRLAKRNRSACEYSFGSSASGTNRRHSTRARAGDAASALSNTSAPCPGGPAINQRCGKPSFTRPSNAASILRWFLRASTRDTVSTYGSTGLPNPSGGSSRATWSQPRCAIATWSGRAPSASTTSAPTYSLGTITSRTRSTIAFATLVIRSAASRDRYPASSV
jgi:hypothetical protein